MWIAHKDALTRISFPLTLQTSPFSNRNTTLNDWSANSFVFKFPFSLPTYFPSWSRLNRSEMAVLTPSLTMFRRLVGRQGDTRWQRKTRWHRNDTCTQKCSPCPDSPTPHWRSHLNVQSRSDSVAWSGNPVLLEDQAITLISLAGRSHLSSLPSLFHTHTHTHTLDGWSSPPHFLPSDWLQLKLPNCSAAHKSELCEVRVQAIGCWNRAHKPTRWPFYLCEDTKVGHI